MKNSIFIFLLSMLAFWGCQNTQTVLSDAEKEQIKEEVATVFGQMMKGADDHNPDEMMSHAWNNDEFIYVSNGTVINGWEAMMKTVASIHANPEFQSYTVNIEETVIKVICNDAAMVTATGYFGNFPGEQGPRTVQMAVTYLFEKIDGKWLVTIGHESTQEKLL